MFRKLADEAYLQLQKEQAAILALQHAETSNQTRRHFAELVNNACEPRSVDGVFVEVGDGINLCHYVDKEMGGYYAWQVVQTCPECNRITLSIYCHNLAEIGRMLKEFEPISGQYIHDTMCSHFVHDSLMP